MILGTALRARQRRVINMKVRLVELIALWRLGELKRLALVHPDSLQKPSAAFSLNAFVARDGTRVQEAQALGQQVDSVEPVAFIVRFVGRTRSQLIRASRVAEETDVRDRRAAVADPFQSCVDVGDL